jgi:site-specific recombinase XerD
MARGRVYNRIYTDDDWDKVNKENKNLMEDFLTELKSQKKKDSTLKQYRNDLRIVLIYILKEHNNKSILQLNKKHFRNMSLWLSGELNLSNARCNRLMSAVRSMLDFAENDDDYEYEINFAKKVKGLPREEVREIHFLSDEIIIKLREYLREHKEYQKMCLLDLAYDSAGRRNELFQVKKEDLLEKNNTNIVIGKRGKKFPLIYLFNSNTESLG